MHNQQIHSTPSAAGLARDMSTSTAQRKEKNTAPATETATTLTRKKKPVVEMVLFGVMSLIAYGFIFTNESLVTKTFTLGGWHAAFPVLTAFFFSFIHGAFASNLLSVLGLEAKKA